MAVDSKTLNNELIKISNLWKKTKPVEGFGYVDDGDYVGKLMSMKVGTSKGESNRIQCLSVWKIMDEGDFNGKAVNRFDGLTAESLGYFKSYCHTIGLELGNDAREWNDECEAFVTENTTLFNLQIKSKGSFQNIFIKGPSDLEEVPAEEVEGLEELDTQLDETDVVEIEDDTPPEEEDIDALKKKIAQLEKKQGRPAAAKPKATTAAKPKSGTLRKR